MFMVSCQTKFAGSPKIRQAAACLTNDLESGLRMQTKNEQMGFRIFADLKGERRIEVSAAHLVSPQEGTFPIARPLALHPELLCGALELLSKKSSDLLPRDVASNSLGQQNFTRCRDSEVHIVGKSLPSRPRSLLMDRNFAS
jgi:hypothetical protein